MVRVLRIAICDDDRMFIQYLRTKLVYIAAGGIEMDFLEYHNGQQFLNSLYGMEEIDLLFLDVQMPGMDGYAVAREFRERCSSTILIFCSSVCMPTPESFKVTPYRYLLKQYTDKQLESELQEVLSYSVRKKEQPFVWGSYEKAHYKLSLDDILYISIAKRGVTIHLHPNSEPAQLSGEMTSREKLPKLYEAIHTYGFAYAHNSYAVNMRYITKRTASELELIDGSALTISRSKEKRFDTDFVKYLAGKY